MHCFDRILFRGMFRDTTCLLFLLDVSFRWLDALTERNLWNPCHCAFPFLPPSVFTFCWMLGVELQGLTTLGNCGVTNQHPQFPLHLATKDISSLHKVRKEAISNQSKFQGGNLSTDYSLYLQGTVQENANRHSEKCHISMRLNRLLKVIVS